jgi:hypothetical protein
MTTTPLSPDGPATDKEWENAVKAWLSELGMGLVQRNEPPFVYSGRKWQPLKAGSGWPDYAIVTGVGTPSHYVEVKLSSEPRVKLGGDGTAGVSDSQAARMDALSDLGHRCWIALRWEVPDSVRAKSLQGSLDGARAPLPYAVQLLIPWKAWRALRAAAVDARDQGGKVEASIPAVDLAALGWPLRSANELRKALTSDP